MGKPCIRISHWDRILILGIILAPMTGLRIWKVGPGECLCLLWCFPRLLGLIKYKKLRITIVVKMFAGFLLSLLVGTMIGRIVAPEEQILSDWFTWIYLSLIAATVYRVSSDWSIEYTNKVIETSLCLSVIWYFLLYIYSLIISRTLLSAPLWYGSGARYSGGATNPHQVATVFCIATLYFGIQSLEKRKITKLLLAGSAVFLLIQTKATTGYAAVAFGAFVYIVTIVLRTKKSIKNRWYLLIISTVFGIIIIALNWESLMDLLTVFLDSDPNGSSRMIIFSNIGNTFSKSPIFGLGPGIHSLWPGVGMIEYHNTFLEILADAGIVGEIVLVRFILRLIKVSMAEPKYLSIFTTIFVYCAAGFIMRRLIFWAYICLFLVYLEKGSQEKQSPNITA